MENQVLGNRYELIEKIGGGGMAVVYKAKCRLLNRLVAVKILRSEFIDDEEFVKRFRVEAQSAASLSHPNIVSIYDVGCENDFHYIVMELIEGVTLKEYINQKGALGWHEAVNIAMQICSAIEQAHKRHIVHRDIKPHNILITREGIAKVTDFGIAKAVTSSTITMVGSTIGSVHYFSPEQARGGYTDEKSDLYSLGIVLYEMVTGRIPFDAETPVAVALKHIQDQATQPVELKPDIPGGVNDIIMKAIMKDKNSRYQTASEMLADLSRVLKDPEIRHVEDPNTGDRPTVRIQDINSVLKKEKEEKDVETNPVIKPSDEGKKKERLTTWFAIATSIVIVAVLAVVAYQFIRELIQPEQEYFVIENYENLNINDVKPKLEEQGIDVTENRVPSVENLKDIIIAQDVEAGTRFKIGGYNNKIEFDVGDGPLLVTIPDFTHKQRRLAEADLAKLNLATKVVREYSDEVGEGMVIRTDPPALSEVPPDQLVIIYESLGPNIKKVQVPNLIGMTVSQAKSALLEVNLKLGDIEPAGTSSTVATVIGQLPLPETEVDEETAVDIRLDIQGGTKTGTGEGTQSEPSQGQSGGQNDPGETGGNSTQPVSTAPPESTTKNGMSGERRNVGLPLNLDKPESYKEKVNVRVEVLPSDTNKIEVIYNQDVEKDRFPFTIQIPVPEGGSSLVKIFYDRISISQFTLP